MEKNLEVSVQMFQFFYRPPAFCSQWIAGFQIILRKLLLNMVSRVFYKDIYICDFISIQTTKVLNKAIFSSPE